MNAIEKVSFTKWKILLKLINRGMKTLSFRFLIKQIESCTLQRAGAIAKISPRAAQEVELREEQC